MSKQTRLSADRGQRQGGFTLIEVLVTLAIITTMSVAVMSVVNFSKSDGQILFSTMNSTASAAQRFAMDNGGCYPYKTGMLFNKSLVSGSTSNSCSVDLSSTWNGPYSKSTNLNGAGQITLSREGHPLYDYRLRGVDILKARDSMKKQAMLLFASGAHEVIVPDMAGTRLRDLKDIPVLARIDISNGTILFGGPHPAGALRMGKDPARSVVAPSHEATEGPNLFVADPSVFPRPHSVDPSLTIMAFAVVAARNLLQRLA